MTSSKPYPKSPFLLFLKINPANPGLKGQLPLQPGLPFDRYQ